jgi:hypothetical protein
VFYSITEGGAFTENSLQTPENFSVVRRIVLNVLKNMQDKLSVARRRRRYAYDQDYLESVITTLIHA